MAYNPSPKSKAILDQAWNWIQSVEYQVTVRWVFYRLLQDGIYSEKKGYRHLLSLTSKARKGFYAGWRPWTLADDTRAPILMQRQGFYGLHLRGHGFQDEDDWLARIKEEINCPLDRWASQPIYSEIWFEAAAMQGQFLHYANENMPLLAFRGDISIPEKWRSAERLAERYQDLGAPIHIYYFGDYDPKGLLIPASAWRDILAWTIVILNSKGLTKLEALESLAFHRVGINREQIEELRLPENPERSGTYQWEALDDNQARQLISRANELLAMDRFAGIKEDEELITDRFKQKLTGGEHG